MYTFFLIKTLQGPFDSLTIVVVLLIRLKRHMSFSYKCLQTAIKLALNFYFDELTGSAFGVSQHTVDLAFSHTPASSQAPLVSFYTSTRLVSGTTEYFRRAHHRDNRDSYLNSLFSSLGVRQDILTSWSHSYFHRLFFTHQSFQSNCFLGQIQSFLSAHTHSLMFLSI